MKKNLVLPEKKLFVLRKTRNGWIVTDDTGYIPSEAVEQSYVFETIKGVCNHLTTNVT